MVGYLTKKFSTLLKGLGATSWKEKREARKLIMGLKREDHELYVEIRNKVKEHHVTSALGELDALIKKIRKSAEYAEKLIFNVLTTDEKILEAEKNILESLKELSTKTGNNPVLKKLVRELALSIYEGTKLGEAEEREEYRQVLLILESAHTHHKAFMEAIRLRFQKEEAQTIFAVPAVRMEISREIRDIKILKKIASDLKVLIGKIGRGTTAGEGEERVRKLLEDDYELIRGSLKDAFYESFLIKKRDLTIVLKILFNLENLRQFLINWAEENNLPRSNVKNLELKIENLEEVIAKDFQPIAQGFRRVIAEVQEMEKLALQEAN